MSVSRLPSLGSALPLLICFSQLRWNFVFQRPQHLMTRAAKTHRVIFFEEPVLWQNEARLDLKEGGENILIAVPHLPHGTSPAATQSILKALLNDLIANYKKDAELVLWYSTPMMFSFSNHLDPNLLVYDNMDELSAFKFAPEELVQLESELLKRADVVFTGGMSIYEAKRTKHPFIHPMPSSIDYTHFAQAREWREDEPSDQKFIKGAPKIGWAGVIDERFDTDLLDNVACLRPQWHFIMLGPVVKINPETLPKRPNIHWLGQKDYKDLPAYMAFWDAAFIPYALNEATRYISPTKTPEFLAAGLPVCATSIRDIVRPYGEMGLVTIVDDARSAVEGFEKSMSKDRGAFLTKVDAFLADKSWDRTWNEMASLMQNAKSCRPTPQVQQRKIA